MKRSNDSPARAALKRLCTLLGLILAVMLSITLYFQSWLTQNGHAGNQSLPAFSLELPELEVPEFLSQLQSKKIGGQRSGIINILLVGQDRREGEAATRSDSMILCTYQKDTHKLIMTSFLRDLYVPIPGHKNNRMNAAYAIGGIDLLEETLEENFGIAIDGTVEADFSQFADIVDLMGGVELTLRQDEADFINEETNSALTEGLQLLNGDQALVYTRIRSLDTDGDFSRTNRQRKVLTSIVDHYQSASLSELLALVDDLLPMLSTDMSSARILTLALEIVPNLSGMDITSQSIPTQGTYTDEIIDGMAVLVADPEAVREVLEQTLLS